MEEKPNEDLKTEEETPAGDDQPEEKTTGSDEGTSGASEEMESISKSELEQLRKDAGEKENYRKAVINYNRKSRTLPGSEPEKKPQKQADDDDDFDDEKINPDDFVTKKELVLRDEKRAINEACKDEEIALNWNEIIVFYQRPKENSYDTQLNAIQSAYKLWRADKGIIDTSDKDKAAKAKSDLASEKGLNKGKDKKPAPKAKKHIIPKRKDMKDWYN